MKIKKTFAILMAAGLSVTSVAAFTACGGGTVTPGGTITIKALLEGNEVTGATTRAFVDVYNAGQGKTDKVFVDATIMPNESNVSNSEFTRSVSKAYNVISVSDTQGMFQYLATKRDNKKAPNGYFLNLQPYADADEDFKKNTIGDSTMNWWRMTYEKDARGGAGQKKHVTGAGQPLLGVPYLTEPEVNVYNKALAEAQGINIIHVPEEQLAAYNTEHGTNIQPHGYAEYKISPFEGAKSSQNLAGKTVYKVFNDCIGMNWEEQRQLFKYFSPNYNSAATTDYAFNSEWWFNYGYSVGGDVMGFNGTSYDFTLLDKSTNFLVTKDGTVVNGTAYKAGQIVLHEDKIKDGTVGVDANGKSTKDGLYAIASQYDAIKEFIALQVGENVTVDSSDGEVYKGYNVAVATYQTEIQYTWFDNEKLFMMKNRLNDVPDRWNRVNSANFDVCVSETYREYEGGSVYYEGGEDFRHEFLKVIGEEYDDGVYTGVLKEVDGTPIVGNSTAASITRGLVIPACSDPEKYQAAWNFISWAATEGQQYLTGGKAYAPAAKDVLMSDKYAFNAQVNNGKNYYAIAKMASDVSRGDWGYFENGAWVTSWADYFNGQVRLGYKTLSDFSAASASTAVEDLDKMTVVIKGIR